MAPAPSRKAEGGGSMIKDSSQSLMNLNQGDVLFLQVVSSGRVLRATVRDPLTQRCEVLVVVEEAPTPICRTGRWTTTIEPVTRMSTNRVLSVVHVLRMAPPRQAGEYPSVKALARRAVAC